MFPRFLKIGKKADAGHPNEFVKPGSLARTQNRSCNISAPNCSMLHPVPNIAFNAYTHPVPDYGSHNWNFANPNLYIHHVEYVISSIT